MKTSTTPHRANVSKKYAFSFNQVLGVVLVQFVNMVTSTSVSSVVVWITGPHPPPAPITPNRGQAGQAHHLPHPRLTHATRMIYPVFQSIMALFLHSQPYLLPI